jgi:hypothetical protein
VLRYCIPLSLVAFQYVNYSNITLKSGGPNANSEEQLAALENGDVEARINVAVLRVPECGQCKSCTEKTEARKLCEKRLEARKKLIAQETKLIQEEESKGDKKKGVKKRKPEQAVFHAPKKMKAPPGQKKKPPPKLMKKANGQLKPRVTSQGNKRMSIPEELFPDFCRRIGANGTGERMKLINQFAEENPTVSVRQVTLRLGEITTKDLPKCVEPPEKKTGRAFMFYLRPRFYKYLPEGERPDGWEQYAEDDAKRWQEEKQAMKLTSKSASSTGSVGADSASDKMDGSVTGVSPSVIDDDEEAVIDDDEEETEDEGEPISKRLKVE